MNKNIPVRIIAMIMMIKSTFTDYSLCAKGHRAEPFTSIVLMFMLSDCLCHLLYKLKLRKDKAHHQGHRAGGRGTQIHTQASRRRARL